MGKRVQSASCSNNIDCSEIIPGFLYLGSAQAAKNLSGLRKLHISHVLNLAGKNYHDTGSEGLTYQKLHFEDSLETDFLSKLPVALEFLDSVHEMIHHSSDATPPPRGAVLVHCSGGVSRSPTTVIAYLMYKNRWSLRQSFLFVKEKRSGIKPNPGFMKQLMQYEMELLGSNSIEEKDLPMIHKLKPVSNGRAS